MKKPKIIATYKMDLNAFHEALKTKYFIDKFVNCICLDEQVKFPFGEQRVMSISIPILGNYDKKGDIITAKIIYEVVGPSLFMERVYSEVCELKKNGQFSKKLEMNGV